MVDVYVEVMYVEVMSEDDEGETYLFTCRSVREYVFGVGGWGLGVSMTPCWGGDFCWGGGGGACWVCM